MTPSANNIRYINSCSENRSNTFQLSPEEIYSFRHRSSFDQATLNQLKELTCQSKLYDQFPWTFRKLSIRRHFHRNTKKSSTSKSKHLTNDATPIINDESTNLKLLSNSYRKSLRRPCTEIDLLTKTSIDNERQNPYLSYFFIPSNRPTILTPESFSY